MRSPHHGRTINSGDYDGLDLGKPPSTRIASRARGKECGAASQTNYRLRDWGVSRQRYWGCPIPMIHCDDCGVVPVPENRQLPVVLPTDVYSSMACARRSSDHAESFSTSTAPSAAKAARAGDRYVRHLHGVVLVLRQVCLTWQQPIRRCWMSAPKLWTPVDHYVGGIEHAILHLLYARFYHKLLRDEGTR